jgi:hypothetical protein
MYQHEVKDEFLREIGHIAVSFSLLEEILRFLVIALVDEPQRIGVIITSELSFKNLKSLAFALAKEKLSDGSELNRLRELIKEITALEEERNRIMHSGWGTDDDNQEVITRSKDTAKEKHGLRFVFEDYTVQKLRQVGDSMLALAGKLEAFQDALIETGKVDDPYKK